MNLFDPAFAPFTISLMIMGLILVVELIGTLMGASASQMLDSSLPDLDADGPDAGSGIASGLLSWLYVVDAWEGGIPSARYLGVMADAAEIAGAPAEYVHDIRTRPSRNIGPGHGG